jgi:hypothetical protein
LLPSVKLGKDIFENIFVGVSGWEGEEEGLELFELFSSFFGSHLEE